MRYLLMLAGLVPLVSQAELAKYDAEALGRVMQSTVATAKTQLNAAIAAGDRSRYPAIKQPVLAEVRAWPEANLANEAAFAYGDCKQAALDLITYGDTWVRNDPSKQWRDYILKRFRESEAACAAAIKASRH